MAGGALLVAGCAGAPGTPPPPPAAPWPDRLQSLLPADVLKRISNRILNEVKGYARVCLDISSKPPATIEWE